MYEDSSLLMVSNSQSQCSKASIIPLPSDKRTDVCIFPRRISVVLSKCIEVVVVVVEERISRNILRIGREGFSLGLLRAWTRQRLA
jgi:hypothetical protein